jgi:hypothetical protein
MRKIFTLLCVALLATGLFAATEPAWYNDVTSITANGQYYIYSVNGKAFVQAGQAQVKAITTSNYTNVSTFKFKISAANQGYVTNGSYYLKSYMVLTGNSNSGPVCTKQSDDGTKIIWTSMNSGEYWNIHSYYNAWFADRYPALRYQDNKYDGYMKHNGGIDYSSTKDTQTGTEFRWYLVSQAQLDRHFAIYFFDAYKESLNIAQYENHVPAAYYTALQTAYSQTFSVQNAAHSAEVVNAAKTNLETLYNGAADVAAAYATATAAINALEAIEDKGEDFAEVTADITNARTALEQAMSVEAVNAAVAGLKAVDPITFNVTEFEAPNFVTNAASTVAGRAITYNAENKAIINAEGKAIHVGKTKLTATAAATDAYYKFVRSAEVTVTAPATYGTYEQTTCDESVTFFGKEYTESTKEDVKVGENWMGGDSIVRVNITINHATFSEESLTITYGDRASWNGAALSDSTVGVHTMVYVTTNAAGCDSTVTLTLTVNKMATLEVPETLEFCVGGSETYRGVEYTEAGTYEIPAEGEIRDTLYTVKVAANPVYSFSETGKAKVGEGYTWQGTNYETPVTGTFKYEAPYTTVNGCDSIYYLTLTVTKADVVEVPVELSFCAGGSETFRGVEYTEANTYNVSAEGDIRDTLYIVNVTVLQPSYSTDTKTITFGDEAEWNGIALSDSTVGVHYVVYETTNAAGCDSIVTLTLTVEKMSAFEAEKELEFCEGDSVEYRGVWYSTAGEYPVLVEDDVRDTLINVIVTVHEKAYAELERTVLAGNVLTLPEGEWTIGDQVVIGTYETLRGDTLGLELYQYDETEFGCESVVKLIVTVTPNYEAIETVSVGEQAEKFFQNGAIYIRRGEKKYSVEGKLVK